MRKAGQVFQNDPRRTTASGNPALGDSAGGWVKGNSPTRQRIMGMLKARNEKRKQNDPEGHARMMANRKRRKQKMNTPLSQKQIRQRRQRANKR